MAHLKKTPTYRGKSLSDESIHSYGQSLITFCYWLEQEEKLPKPITPRFKPLHHYLTTHRAFLAGSEVSHKEDAVFLADNGEPLTQWGVSMLFKRLKKRT